MKKFKRILAAVVAGVIMVGLAGCGSSPKNGSAAASDKDLKKVIIGTGGAEGELQENALIAQNKGYIEAELEKVGYYPEYQGFAQMGPAINEAFASDSIDLAVYGDFPAITAVSNKVGVEVIANGNSDMTYAILAGDDSGISSVTDLKGKNICVPFGTVTYKYLVDVLEKNGLSIDDVNVINTATDGPTMIASGDADAIVSTVYAVLIQRAQLGSGTIIEDSTDEPELGTTYVAVARTKFAEQNEDAVVAFIKALQDAYEYAQQDTDGASNALVTSSTPLEVVQKTYVDTSFSYFNPDLTNEFKEKLQSSIDFMIENQLIQTEVSYDDVVNASYLEKALG